MKGTIQERGNKFKVRYWDSVQKKEIYKSFDKYKDAEMFLMTLNVKKQEGILDARDYGQDQPLGISNLSRKWLEIKETEVKCIRNLRGHMGKLCDYFGNKNIKGISYAELEDFVHFISGQSSQVTDKKPSSKTVKNVHTTVHSFFVWCQKRKYITSIPEFPEVKFELGWRNTVSKDIQGQILDEVYRISYHINPKIWIGIKWLSTYISIRPIELINIKEGDFDLSLGVVNVKHNKENKPKIVPLLVEDVELAGSFPTALPGVYFFRHGKRKGVHRSKRGRFGKDYLYKWWKKACDNLQVSNVDLYGGTRHSSAKALRRDFTPEQIKKYGTLHATNSAFERYFQHELEDSRDIYKQSRGAARVLPIKKGQGKGGK